MVIKNAEATYHFGVFTLPAVGGCRQCKVNKQGSAGNKDFFSGWEDPPASRSILSFAQSHQWQKSFS